jgi:DNA polymerase III epsilon subunit-like protein
MNAIHSLLEPGILMLDEDGGLTGEKPDAEVAASILGDSLLVMDLEMSGPHPKMHEVLDIGGVHAEIAPGVPEKGSFGSRIKPLHIGTADHGALKVVGYSSKAWKDSIPFEKAFEQFTKLGAGTVVAGWGIGHDMAFLAESYRRLGMDWPFAPVALDIQLVARNILTKSVVDRFNLGHVADRLGIGRMGEHGALADAYATYDVLVELCARGTSTNEGS